MDEASRTAAEEQHREELKKHKAHPKVNHPVSIVTVEYTLSSKFLFINFSYTLSYKFF